MTSLSFLFVLRIFVQSYSPKSHNFQFLLLLITTYDCAQIICKLDYPCMDSHGYTIIVILVSCMMLAGCVASVRLALFLQSLSYYHISEINNVMCKQVATNVLATTCLVCR
jgi:hypothetical protein